MRCRRHGAACAGTERNAASATDVMSFLIKPPLLFGYPLQPKTPLDPADFHASSMPPTVRWRSDRSRNKNIVKNIDRKSELRSEEHTSELKSLMRISSSVFCLKQKYKLQ